MNKLLSLKHLSPSSLQRAPLIPSKSLHHDHHHHALKQFHSIAPKPTFNFSLNQPQWHCYAPKTYGFFSKHVLSKNFSSIAHFKGTFNSFLGTRLCSLRTQFPSNTPSVLKRKWNSWFQGYSGDNIVIYLVAVNAAVFVLWRVLDRDFMYKNFTISVDNLKSGRLHTLITCAFSHIDMGHLVSNMIGLYFFGNNIVRYFGPEYLLKLYFTGAVVGSIFYIGYHAFIAKTSQNRATFGRDSSKTPGLGASGAMNAILLLDIFLFPKATLMFDFFIPVPAILLGIYLIGSDVLRIVEGDPQVSGSAHLGGAAVAAAAWLRLKKGRGFRF